MDPAGIDDKLIQLYGDNDILMPHMHLSVQSGDDTILRRMARRHRRSDVLQLTEKLRAVRPDFVFGADFITGFPTETDDMFAHTIDLVKQANIILLHVFPFSVRPSTPSAKMEMVDVPVRKQRAKALRQVGHDLLNAYLNNEIGKYSSVLVETGNSGFNEHYIPVKIANTCQAGQIIQVLNEKVKENGFVGKI
jgi:threonylcarbamoyladenosine tRNA methylthiotransferase MtaB